MSSRSEPRRSTSGSARGPHGDHRDRCVAVVPLFAGLSPAERHEVARSAHQRTLPRLTVLYPQGSDDPPLTIVHRGRVKLVRISPAGHEQMLRVLGPGDVVGETAFLTSSPADHVATTLEETEVCELHRSDARRLLERFPSVSNRLLVELARRLESTERHLSRLTSQDTRQRIVAHLLEVADGRTEFRLPTTKRDLASLVGTTPETLSRQLAALQDRGWIRLGPRGAVKLVDAAALAEL